MQSRAPLLASTFRLYAAHVVAKALEDGGANGLAKLFSTLLLVAGQYPAYRAAPMRIILMGLSVRDGAGLFSFSPPVANTKGTFDGLPRCPDSTMPCKIAQGGVGNQQHAR